MNDVERETSDNGIVRVNWLFKVEKLNHHLLNCNVFLDNKKLLNCNIYN
jgi:hypothetical protein